MSLSQWFRRLINRKGTRSQTQDSRRPLSRWPNRPRLERLEERLAPATNITIIATGVGNLDHFLSASNGTITTANDPGDTAATLSKVALQGVGPGVNISITADNNIVFQDLGTLNLQTGLGNSDGFFANSGPILFNNVANNVVSQGGSFDFSAGTDLLVSNLNTNGGDVFLTAGTAAAGDLTFESILTNGSGNLTFQATNAAGGTITQNTGAAVGQAISATATGNVTVNSLRGTTVGLTSNTGAVNSAGSQNVQASATLTVDAVSGITLNTLASALEATNSTSGNISITQAASPAQTMTITGSGVVNDASGGTVTLTNNGASIAVGGNGVASTNGTVTLAATDLQINAAVNSGTARTILTTSVAGRAINLGTNAAGSVGITAAEVGEVTAGVLQIGSAIAGAISITDAINTSAGPGFTSTLTLVNNGPITENNGDLLVQNLRISSAGPVTIGNAQISTLAADVTGAFSFENPGVPLTVGVVDGDTGIVTANSDVTLISDDVEIQQSINAGTGAVNLEPFTNSLQINLGAASVPGSTFGLTDAELGQVTAGVLRIGDSSNTGGITISSAITRHAGFNTLSLLTGVGSVDQTAALSVANLRVNTGSVPPFNGSGTVTLTNAGNDVDTLTVDTPGRDIAYTDANGFAVGTVDGQSGISTGASGNVTIVLTAGGAVTQTTGAGIVTNDFLLLGSGPYTLGDSTNQVAFLAANVTNAISFVNSAGLLIDAVNGTVGVTTTNADISISAASFMQVDDNVSAGTGAVSLTVTGAGGQYLYSGSTPAITGSAATVTADRMTLTGGTINVGTGGANIVTLKPFSSGRAVDLGTNNNTSDLGLRQADLNTVTAGTLRVGDFTTTGNITVTAALTDATTSYKTLSLLTGIGGGISQDSGATLTFTNLQAAGNTGVTLNENNVVSTLAGATQSGAFSFTDSTNLVVGTVDSSLGFGFGSGIITDGQSVNLTVNTAGDSLTVNQAIDETHDFGSPASGGANMNLTADAMTFNAAVDGGTGGAVQLNPFTTTETIAVGGADAAGTLGLSDADFSNLTGQSINLGSSLLTGPITIDGTVTRHAGYNTLALFAPQSSITQTTGSVSVANLAIEAGAGIGSSGAIQVVGPVNLAFRNNTSNNVQIASTGALTIAGVNFLDGSAGHEIGNFASGGTVTMSAASPITFAINTTSSGTITETTTETAGEGNTPLPPPDDDITVNSGVTVESTGGDVNFTAGDSVVLQAGSTVKSDSGTVSLTAGVGDIDNDANLTLGGTISAVNITLNSPGDIGVSGLSATGTISITSTNGAILDIGDTGETEPTNPADDFSNGASVDITADSALLSASTGIGVVLDGGVGPLETQVSNLEANTATGGIFITNGVTSAVTLNIVGNGFGPPDGVVNTGATGDVQLVNNGSIDVVTLNAIVESTDNVTVEAVGATADVQTGGQTTLNAIRSTGSGTVFVSAGEDILMGNATGFGDITSLSGTATANAGRDLIIDSGSGLFVHTGSGAVTGTAGRNITLQATGGVTGANVSDDTGSGNISLTTGAGGVFTLNSGAGGEVHTVGGNITISADDMVINDPVTAGTGIVTLQQATGGVGSTARDVSVGSGTTANTLGLSDAELGEVTASVLRIGRTDNTGNLGVDGQVTTHAGFNTLDLRSGGAILDNNNNDPDIAVTNLALQAANGIADGQTPAQSSTLDLDVVAVAALNTTSGSIFLSENSGANVNLAVGTVDGVVGISNTATTNLIGSVIRADTGNLTINSAVSTGADSLQLQAHGGGMTFTNNAAVSTTTAASIDVSADQISLSGGTITAGAAGRVILEPESGGQPIDLGGNGSGTRLSLTNADLNTVTTTGTLQVGSGGAGDITVTAAVAPANVGTLDLETGGGVSGLTAADAITVTNLAVRAVTAVNMNQNYDVTTGALAAVVTGPGQPFRFLDINGLTVGSVDGLNGITTNGGEIIVTAEAGNLTVNRNVTAGAGVIELAAVGSNSLFTNSAVISNSGGNELDVSADRMALGASPTSALTASGGLVSLVATSNGRLLNLGSALDTTANTLELSNTELNTVTASTLEIGGGLGGAAIVSAAISLPTVTSLTIFSTGSITGTGTLSVSELRLNATDTVDLEGNGVSFNNVGTLSGLVSAAGQSFTFVNLGALDINTVDGVSGITTSGGAIAVTTISGNVTVDKNVAAAAAQVDLTAGGTDSFITNNAAITGNTAKLIANRMALGAGTINVGTAATDIVTLQPSTAGRTIDLGGTGDPTGTLQLSQTELNTITAGIVRIGSNAAGNLTVAAPVSATNFGTLTLLSNGAIATTGTGAVMVTNLDLQGAGGINLSAAPSTVSGSVAGSTSGGKAFSFMNTVATTVGTVDGQSGVTTNGGSINLTATTGILTINQAITAGNAPVALTADSMAINAAVSAGTNAVILSPQTANRTIDLGHNTAGTLGLTQAELNLVTASFLDVGTVLDTGSIQVSAAIAAGTHFTGLFLTTGGSIVEQSGGSLQVRQLNMQAAGAGIGSVASPLPIAVTAFFADTTNNSGISLAATGTATVSGTPTSGGLGAGTGTITLSGGTFVFAANNQIAATSHLVVGSGTTLNLNTFSETVLTLTLSGTSTLAATINGFGAGQAGNLTVNSFITLNNATLSLSLGGAFKLPPTGTVLTLVHNNGHAFVNGTFAGAANNSTIVVGGHHFQINYFGGTSECDITLTSLD